MIRINAFFEIEGDANKATALSLIKELVEKSLADKGNVAYDFFQSVTRTGVMMICETWQDEESLNAHKAAVHFVELVPKIKALSKNGFKSETFTF